MNNARQIRVFVSSTFRDMQAERDELLSRIFPEIRFLCKQRNVDFVEVDLRWGITEDQAERGEVIPICLNEVERCRPYFIGILGERYGWVPPVEELGRVEGFEWLADYPEISVTEMEILHGVLRDPEMRHHAFFFYRDPSYIERVPESERDIYVAGPGDREKQLALKSRIQEEGFPTQIFADPEELAGQVRQTLIDLVDQLYPETDTPDWLTIEQIAQDAFQASRARVYIERPALFDALDAAALSDAPQPALVLGPSGSGKSALIANWAQRYVQSGRAQGFFFLHFIGGTPYSTHPFVLLYRLVGSLMRYLGTGELPPQDMQALVTALPDYLARAASHGRVLLVLDALDQLDDVQRARNLAWLPSPLPEGVRLITSTLPGDTLEAFERRGFDAQRIEITPLRAPEREEVITTYLGRYRKQLNAERTQRLRDAESCQSPLYLRTLLEELRVFGTHELLDQRISELLATPDIPALFDAVLARLEDELEDDHPDLVGDCLSLIWASRRGLSEPEILGALGLAPLHWAPLYMALEPSLVSRTGQLSFFHNFLRSAVEARYLPDAIRRKTTLCTLADYFLERPLNDPRRAEELPELLARTQQWSALAQHLVEHETFDALFTPDREYELLGYWLDLEETGFDRVKAYESALEVYAASQPEPLDLARRCHELGRFFQLSAHFEAAIRADRKALSLREQVLPEDHEEIASSLNNLGVALLKTGNHTEAEPLLRRSLELDEKRFGRTHDKVAVALNNLGSLLESDRRFEEAHALFRDALDIAQEVHGPDHPETASYLRALAALQNTRDHTEEAESLYRQALEISERHHGPEHAETGLAINGIASVLLAQSRPQEAEELYQRALQISEQVYGPQHPETLVSLNNLAGALEAQGRYDEAEVLYTQALERAQTLFGDHHSEVIAFLINLSDLYQKTRRFDDAQTLLLRALEASRSRWGEDHENVTLRLHNLAILYQEQEDYTQAKPLLRQIIDRQIQHHGEGSDEHAIALNNLAYLLYLEGSYDEAESWFRASLELSRAAHGPASEEAAGTLDNLARTLRQLGRMDEAHACYEEALTVLVGIHGEPHADVARLRHNHGALLTAMGQLDEARASYEQACATREAILFPGHPSTQISVQNLAEVCEMQGDAQTAVQRYHQLYTMLQVRGGELHDHVVAMNNIARNCQHLGAADQARAWLDNAYQLWSQAAGSEHPESLALAANLAQAEVMCGLFDQAEARLLEVIEAQERTQGSTYEVLGTNLFILAQAQVSQGKHEAGIATLERELSLCEDALGPDHEETEASRVNLAQLRTQLGL